MIYTWQETKGLEDAQLRAVKEMPVRAEELASQAVRNPDGENR